MHSNPDPPPIIVGLLSSDIGQTIAYAAELFNTPVMSDFATAATLSDKVLIDAFCLSFLWHVT
jgi:hypothetical protein